MKITIPDGDRFQFTDGTLASDYIACEDTMAFFHQGSIAITPAEWPALGISEFAIRCICHLDKASNKREGPRIKYTILLIPLSIDELRNMEPSSYNSASPGFKLHEGTAAFLPATDSSTWGDPICPLILRGSPASEAPYTPPRQEILFNIAAVMRTARVAVACKTANGWRKQWDKAMEDTTDLEKEPLITWPETARHPAPQGRLTIYKTLALFPLFSKCNQPKRRKPAPSH